MAATKLKSKRRKYGAKSKILGTLIGLISLLMLCMFSPAFVHKSLSKVDAVTSLALGNNATLDVVAHRYNPKKHLYMQQFMINNGSESGDGTVSTELDGDTAKDLANIKWAGKVVVQSGNTSKIKPEFIEVANRMITVYVHGVPENYAAIRFDLQLKKKNKLLSSMIVADKTSATDLRFYSKQADTKKDAHLAISTNTQLNDDYIGYQVQTLQKAVRVLQKENKSSAADIKQNDKMIADLQKEMKSETAANQTSSQSQIDGYQQTTQTDKDAVNKNNEQIKEYKNQIALLKKQLTSPQ